MSKKAIIRMANTRDLADLAKIDRAVFKDWPEELLLGEEQFRSCIKVFPDGVLISEFEEEPIGYALVQIMDYEKAISQDWHNATDGGFIRKSHNLKGDIAYGISLAVLRKSNSSDAGMKLIETAFSSFVLKRNLKCGVLVSRAPGYFRQSEKQTISEYVYAKRKNGLSVDPLVAFYQRFGFSIVGIIPNFIKDPQSCDYGVAMAMPNPHYKK